MQHAFDADVLVDVRPVDADAIADQLPMVALSRSRFGESPRPGERYAHGAAIDEVSRDFGLADTQVGDAGFNTVHGNRS